MSTIAAVIILGTVGCVIAGIYLIATLSTWRRAWRQYTAAGEDLTPGGRWQGWWQSLGR